MSIHFISGKPGGGKTLYSVRLIVDELVKGNRPIVTNVPLKLGELNRFLQERYPAAYHRRFTSTGRHISDDVILLDEDDLPKFFTFRGDGIRLESVCNVEWKQGKRPDFSLIKDAGVFYVLDEVHIAFNSRAWADTGAEVLYYLSQHRKLGDDVVCITQAVANVDKQFRSVAQDFTYIKNLSKQRAGLFRLPAIFTRNTYAQPATDTAQPMESGTFSLDVSGLASVYDTARGVGIHGRSGADTSARKKGLHWAIAVIGIPLVVICFVHYGPHQIAKFMSGSKPATVASPVSSPAPKPSAIKHQVKQETDAYAEPANARVAGDDPAPAPLTCVGYSIVGGPRAFMSDGSTVEPSDGLQVVQHGFVVINGKYYRVRPALPTPVQDSSVRFGESESPSDVVVQMPPALSRPVNQIQVTHIGGSRIEVARRSSGSLGNQRASRGVNTPADNQSAP